MPKLSATSAMDSDAITRVDLTPERIRQMSAEELEKYLADMRGNREVSQARKEARAASSRAPRGASKAAPAPVDENDFE